MIAVLLQWEIEAMRLLTAIGVGLILFALVGLLLVVAFLAHRLNGG